MQISKTKKNYHLLNIGRLFLHGYPITATLLTAAALIRLGVLNNAKKEILHFDAELEHEKNPGTKTPQKYLTSGLTATEKKLVLQEATKEIAAYLRLTKKR